MQLLVVVVCRSCRGRQALLLTLLLLLTLFMMSIKQLLPTKTDDQLAELVMALDLCAEVGQQKDALAYCGASSPSLPLPGAWQSRASVVMYKELFEEDRCGDQSEFCEAFRDQILRDYMEFCACCAVVACCSWRRPRLL